jgi:hypothetical protein
MNHPKRHRIRNGRARLGVIECHGATLATAASYVSSAAPAVAAAAAVAAAVDKPDAPDVKQTIQLPDPKAQQAALRRSLADQLGRRGRASTILTSPGELSQTLGAG